MGKMDLSIEQILADLDKVAQKKPEDVFKSQIAETAPEEVKEEIKTAETVKSAEETETAETEEVAETETEDVAETEEVAETEIVADPESETSTETENTELAKEAQRADDLGRIMARAFTDELSRLQKEASGVSFESSESDDSSQEKTAEEQLVEDQAWIITELYKKING